MWDFSRESHKILVGYTVGCQETVHTQRGLDEGMIISSWALQNSNLFQLQKKRGPKRAHTQSHETMLISSTHFTTSLLHTDYMISALEPIESTKPSIVFVRNIKA